MSGTWISYAGIGSRDITNTEAVRIKTVAKQMARQNFILYSGNADGADIAFQNDDAYPIRTYNIPSPWIKYCLCKFNN